MRIFDLRLCTLQIASMSLAVLLTLSFVALYHHFTEDYLVPLPEYLGSIKLAAPPLLILFSSYLMTFLLGEKVTDAPKFVFRYLRNSFLQDITWMLVFLIVGVVVLFCSWYTILNQPPPHYATLLAKLLGGEQDRQQLIQKELKSISEKNIDLARHLQLVVDVFELRAKWNFANNQANTTEPRILVRALEANNQSKEWKQHPLRKHALAEAYSMWAQAAKSSIYSMESTDWHGILRKSVETYGEVINSENPLATPLMKASALNNVGNAYLYTGEMAASVSYYNRALEVNKNLSTAGNMIAALIKQKLYDNAIDFGDQYIEWGRMTGKALIEGSSYSAVVGNTAFAHLIRGNYELGAKLMLEAYDLESDDLNSLNFAVALLLNDRPEEAINLVRRHFKYPTLEPETQSKRVTEKYNPCYYVVSSAIEPAATYSSKAASLYMYLGEARTISQLKFENPASLARLITKVEQTLENSNEPCAELILIPKFKSMLRRAYYKD